MLLNPERHWWLIPASLLAAFLWQFWPLEHSTRQWAPDAVLLIALYWCWRNPRFFSSGWAFVIGFLRDAIEGAPLGMHALGLVVLCYLVHLFYKQLRMLALWQQALVIMALCTLHLLIIHWARLLVPGSAATALLWYPAISTGLCWPVCCLLLRQLEEGTQRGPIRA